jgi:hypothetical protein
MLIVSDLCVFLYHSPCADGLRSERVSNFVTSGKGRECRASFCDGLERAPVKICHKLTIMIILKRNAPIVATSQSQCTAETGVGRPGPETGDIELPKAVRHEKGTRNRHCGIPLPVSCSSLPVPAKRAGPRDEDGRGRGDDRKKTYKYSFRSGRSGE